MSIGYDTTVTPKGILTLKSVGNGFSANDIGKVGQLKFEMKRDRFKGSILLTDATIRNGLDKFTDVLATADFKLDKGVTANAQYDLGTKLWRAGGTWEGNLQGLKRASKVQLWYSTANNLVSGDATLTVNSRQKANVLFNQNELLAAKYTIVQNDFTFEPAYNFLKQSPYATVTTRVRGGVDTLKAAYDVRSQIAGLEYNRKPFKIAATTTLGGKGGPVVARPTLSLIFENTYEI